MMKRFLAFFTTLVMCFTIPMNTALAAEVIPSNQENTVITHDDGWTLLEMPDSLANNIIQPINRSTVNAIEPFTIGGTETWYEGMDWSNTFTFYGNNLSPVKTMGITGKLYMHVIYNSSTPVKLVFQIRKAGTSQTLANWTVGANTYYENDFPPISVTKGQKIQIYFKVLDKNGNYDTNRPLSISYGYVLRK